MSGLSKPRQVEIALKDGRIEEALFAAMEDAIDSATLSVRNVVEDCGLSPIVANAIAEQVRKEALDYIGNHY